VSDDPERSQTHNPIASHDQVVEHFNAEQRPGLDESPRQVEVVRRGIRIA